MQAGGSRGPRLAPQAPGLCLVWGALVLHDWMLPTNVVHWGCPAYGPRGPVSWLLMRPRSAQWVPGVTPLESRVLELEPGLLLPGFPHGRVSCPLQNRSLGSVSKSLWGWTQRQPQ